MMAHSWEQPTWDVATDGAHSWEQPTEMLGPATADVAIGIEVDGTDNGGCWNRWHKN